MLVRGSGGGNTPSSDAVISENVIEGAFDFGIHVDSRGRGQERTRNVTIAANNVSGCSPNGLLLQECADVRVTNNHFEGSGSLDGVGVAPACDGCVVEGNTATGAAPPSIWTRRDYAVKTDDIIVQLPTSSRRSAVCEKALDGCWPVRSAQPNCRACEAAQQHILYAAGCTEQDIMQFCGPYPPMATMMHELTLYDVLSLVSLLTSLLAITIVVAFAAANGGVARISQNATSMQHEKEELSALEVDLLGPQPQPASDGRVNVKTFGAKGDGVTDDTAAIQRALDAAPVVYFPPGRYEATHVAVNSNNSLVGAGWETIIHQVHGTNPRIQDKSYDGLFTLNKHNAPAPVVNVSFASMQLQVDPPPAGTYNEQDQRSHVILAGNVQRLSLQNVLFSGWRGDALVLGGQMAGHQVPGFQGNVTMDCTVTDCTFDGISNNTRQGISGLSVDGLTVDGCRFLRCTNATMPGAIDLEPELPTALIRNVTITNSYFENVGPAPSRRVALSGKSSLTSSPMSMYAGWCVVVSFSLARLDAQLILAT